MKHQSRGVHPCSCLWCWSCCLSHCHYWGCFDYRQVSLKCLASSQDEAIDVVALRSLSAMSLWSGYPERPGARRFPPDFRYDRHQSSQKTVLDGALCSSSDRSCFVIEFSWSPLMELLFCALHWCRCSWHEFVDLDTLLLPFPHTEAQFPSEVCL